MPPTTGHLQLIQFASELAERVVVLLTTQPQEPFVKERVKAVRQALLAPTVMHRVAVRHYGRPMDPDPDSEGFRDRWAGIMIGAGAEPGDLLVGSELYGKWLAEMTGMVWMPYDVNREINSVKATNVREHPYAFWNDILPEFRPHLQTRVTIFGAESTGKTTLARQIKNRTYANNWTFLPEYARPYLENTVNEISVRSMMDIWKGQAALQRQQFVESPVVVQDTDLFSTLGYWKFWAGRVESPFVKLPQEERLPLFSVPDQLQADAKELASDLYIVTLSDVDFVEDPLRYGGDHREISDGWWLNWLTFFKLPFKVLRCKPEDRVEEVWNMIDVVAREKQGQMAYDRHGF